MASGARTGQFILCLLAISSTKCTKFQVIDKISQCTINVGWVKWWHVPIFLHYADLRRLRIKYIKRIRLALVLPTFCWYQATNWLSLSMTVVCVECVHIWWCVVHSLLPHWRQCCDQDTQVVACCCWCCWRCHSAIAREAASGTAVVSGKLAPLHSLLVSGCSPPPPPPPPIILTYNTHQYHNDSTCHTHSISIIPNDN